MQRFIALIILVLVGCSDTGGDNVIPAANTAAAPSPTFDSAAQTIVANATATGAVDPQAVPSPFEAQLFGSCDGEVSLVFNGRRSERIQTALDEAAIKDVVVSVIETQDSSDCSNIVTTESRFNFAITVGTLDDDAYIGDILADVLAAVEPLPESTIPGQQPALVSVTFISSNTNAERTFTDVPYERIMGAYAAGVRGASLIAEMGS